MRKHPSLPKVSDLLAKDSTDRPSIQVRIERRRDILTKWLKEGVPLGKSVPSSLTEARLWSDEDLNIQTISSPNEFTKTNPHHGKLVSEVADLLTKLKRRYTVPRPRRKTKVDAAILASESNAFEQQLVAVTSQWHAERAQKMQEKERADNAEARSHFLLQENAQFEKALAEVRRELATAKTLRVLK